MIDPDVFAAKSTDPLRTLDMQGKVILPRYLPEGFLGHGRPYFTTGVMLLDCSKLRHWRWREEIAGIFDHSRDYWDLLGLVEEGRSNIGELSEICNSLDKLTSETGLLHFTRVSTQPWLTGLPMPDDIFGPSVTATRFAKVWRRVRALILRKHKVQSDPNQERLVFDLLADSLMKGTLTESFFRAEVSAGLLRTDAFKMLEGSGYTRSCHGSNPRPDLLSEFGIE